MSTPGWISYGEWRARRHRKRLAEKDAAEPVALSCHACGVQAPAGGDREAAEQEARRLRWHEKNGYWHCAKCRRRLRLDG